jgi:hypothetical protein
VAEFKLKHPTTSKAEKVSENCANDFKAEAPRPASKGLHSTGIAVALCGHAYPLKGASVKLGEKFAYCHVILLALIKAGFVPAFLEYDIACRFYLYMRAHEPELFEAIQGLGGPNMTALKGANIIAGIKFALGVCARGCYTHTLAHTHTHAQCNYTAPLTRAGRFHAWAHQSACQVQWSMGVTEGCGLTPDGEDLERLWWLIMPYRGASTQMVAANRCVCIPYVARCSGCTTGV